MRPKIGPLLDLGASVKTELIMDCRVSVVVTASAIRPGTRSLGTHSEPREAATSRYEGKERLEGCGEKMAL